VFLLLLFSAPAAAQSPSFEAASIRPNNSGDNHVYVRLVPGGGVRAFNASLQAVITTAWQIPDFELADIPGWMKSDRWDIEAKGSGETAPLEILRNLQSLLADRFHLRVHTETRQMPVYALLIAKGGPKLPPAREECWDPKGGVPPPSPMARPCGGFNRAPNQLLGARDTTANLAQVLAKTLGRSVIDRTGLSGTWDVTLKWTPDELLRAGAAFANEQAGSIFTALQEQLGLRLESQKGPVHVLVIDNAERPSPN
ncbi:MAG TPA: TIGR03435 family protein, partial [Bryobacteraceae bacterium]|nr:TIGR03435 family protein [Bryobacteraceae bacterium]